MKQIKSETLETVKNYLLKSIIPSIDAQNLVNLLNEATDVEVKEEVKEVK